MPEKHPREEATGPLVPQVRTLETDQEEKDCVGEAQVTLQTWQRWGRGGWTGSAEEESVWQSGGGVCVQSLNAVQADHT